MLTVHIGGYETNIWKRRTIDGYSIIENNESPIVLLLQELSMTEKFRKFE